MMIKGETELWKTWPKNEKIEVSSFGRIRSTGGHYYKACDNGRGYLRVCFRVNGEQVNKKVHRLVAETFIPNPNDLPEINHRDCNATNDNVSNLEWCTREYNIEYREEHGKTRSLPIYAINLSTLEASWFPSQREAGRVLGIGRKNIYKVIKRKQKQTCDCWFVDADNNAVEITKNRLYDILGDKIKELTVGNTDNSSEVIDFVTQCTL